MVRASSYKRIIEKGYMPNETKEHFTVSQKVPIRKGTKRRVDKLVDYHNDAGNSSWYPKELQKLLENLYRIEKFFRKLTLPDGTKQVFVFWKGWIDR